MPLSPPSPLRLDPVLAGLIADLADELPAVVRYRRLLDAILALVACDALALLRLDGDTLVPLALHGLSPDTLGRRYRVDAHPRLAAILAAAGPVHFDPDCDLPDPHDGQVESVSRRLEIHDCLGCALGSGDRIWGVLTLDALDRGRFGPADIATVGTIAGLAAATLAVAWRSETMAWQREEEKRWRDQARRREPRREDGSSTRAGGLRGRDGDRPWGDDGRFSWTPSPSPLVGESPAFEQLRAEIELVAPSDLTVLVTGETGTGKELVARRLHALSGRADRPLVTVNCAALPEPLVESELFGHVRGAFSGAVADRRGHFASADGGSLFLDEVGELPLVVQAKLLRVLQDGQLQRVGSDRLHRADIRLIAATNRDLATEVRAGRFRADLYHRLGTYPLRVPPLRERGHDVLVLAGAFLEENRRRMGLRGLRLSARAQAALLAHDWPGNVRELEHLIARAALRARGRLAAGERRAIVTLDLQALDLPCQEAPDAEARVAAASGPGATTAASTTAFPDPPDGPGGPGGPGGSGGSGGSGSSVASSASSASSGQWHASVETFQRRLLTETFARHRGNVAASARQLGLDRANLLRLARRLGVEPRRPGAGDAARLPSSPSLSRSGRRGQRHRSP